MKVLMMHDGLVFVNMDQAQAKAVRDKVENAKVKDTAKGLKVQADAAQLYQLLHDLSYVYDIELV